MFEADAKAVNKSESVADEMARARSGHEAMRKCFVERVKNDPAFQRLMKQAQKTIEALTGK